MSMTISSTPGISGTSSIASLSSVSFASTQTTQAAASDGDTSHVSKMGQLMKQLQDLEKSDPAKAKQALTQIASKLNDAAASATGPLGGDDAQHLKDLAAKFSDAAQSGDLSKLEPKAGHHHHAQAQSADEKYKANGPEPDRSQLESIVQDALSSVG